MSPINTTRDTDPADFLRELEGDLHEFNNQGKVIVMGDLNSRIGNRPSIVFRNGKPIIFDRKSADVQIPKRARKRGRQLINIFNSNGMVIINGIDGGGENTFISTHTGQSMIDYIALSSNMFNKKEEEEEEEEYEFKHKLDLNNKHSPLPNLSIQYQGRSLKVWEEFIDTISDHRLVTCRLEVPEYALDQKMYKKIN